MFKQASLLILFFCVSAGARPLPKTAPAASPLYAAASRDEFEIFERINGERRRRGLEALTWNEAAARIARGNSERMARESFFDHIDPNGDSVVERTAGSPLRHWHMIGENLFVCTPSTAFASLAVMGWMRSPSHRQNVLGRQWSSTGIGIGRSRDGRIFVTQIFIDE